MRIKLHFPDDAIAEIKSMGLRQVPTETLRWVNHHPSSKQGSGVLLRGKSGDILDGKAFSTLVGSFGAWIETDSDDTSRRVHNALTTAATGTQGAVKVAQNKT